ERGFVRQESDARPRARASGSLPANLDAPGIGSQKGGDDLQKRCLSGAVPAEEDQDFARVEHEVYATEDPAGAEATVDAGDAQKRRGAIGVRYSHFPFRRPAGR